LDTIISFAFDLLRFFFYDILRGLVFHAGRIVLMIFSLGRLPRKPVTTRQESLIYSVGILVFIGLLAAIVLHRLH